MDQPILFDPSIDELQKIVLATSQITAEDLSDDTQLAVVKETRIQLRDARVAIQKKGKSMREDALKYQKNVITREKELIAIIEPEEIRLSEIEEKASQIRVRGAREALLPMRQEQLVPYAGMIQISNDDILDMDNDQFVSYLVDLQSKKNEKDRADIEAQKAQIAEDARIAQIKKDAETAERERIQAAQEKSVRYQEWLGSIGFKKGDERLWFFQSNLSGVSAYKYVGKFE